jgi:hypothetical protein
LWGLGEAGRKVETGEVEWVTLVARRHGKRPERAQRPRQNQFRKGEKTRKPVGEKCPPHPHLPEAATAEVGTGAACLRPPDKDWEMAGLVCLGCWAAECSPSLQGVAVILPPHKDWEIAGATRI